MHYTLGRLRDESALVEERTNSRIITEAQFIQVAVASIMSKEGRKQFKDLTKMLNVETSVQPGLFDPE